MGRSDAVPGPHLAQAAMLGGRGPVGLDDVVRETEQLIPDILRVHGLVLAFTLFG